MFEYNVTRRMFRDMDAEKAFLNNIGGTDWELVSVVEVPYSFERDYYLRRPITKG